MTHPLTWSRYHAWLQIADRRTQQLVAYAPNTIQADLDQHVKQLAARPVRIIVLKARRFGVSTHLQMRFAHLAFVRSAFHGITGAHLDEASTYLHGMAETAYTHLPAPLRPAKTTGIQGKRLVFTHGSSLRTFTAGGREGVGRSTAATAIHGSEVSLWPDAKGTLAALLQIVPREPGTIVVLESTAQGVGNEFHERWNAAVNGEGGYTPVFYPWFSFADYAANEADTTATLGDDPEWTIREQSLLERGLTRQQLAWRRMMIADECGRDPDIFDQEYPETPEVAFLTSGRPFFRREHLDRVITTPPIRIGRVEGDPIRNGGKLRLVDDEHGELRIWSTPKPGHRYVIGADAAGGVTLDEYAARQQGDGDDFSCAMIIDAETGDQVAEWHARIDGDVFGLELARLGYVYNTARIAVEDSGGYGIAPLSALRRVAYPDLYQRQVLDEHANEWTEKLGWATSSRTRPVLLDTLRAWVREEPRSIHSSGFVSEARTFVTRRNGSPGADTGCHDDRVMALGIAHEVRREGLPVIIGRPKKRQARPKFAAEAAA